MVSSDNGVVSHAEFECSCGMGGRSKDVLDLSSFRQRVEQRRADRVASRPRSVARRSQPYIASILGCSVRGPGTVTWRAIGVSQQTVFAYELGDRRVSVPMLIELARIFTNARH